MDTAARDETDGDYDGRVFGDCGEDGVLAYFKGVFELFLLGDRGGGIVGIVFVAFEDGVVRSENALRC